jgi:hypothetical protein
MLAIQDSKAIGVVLGSLFRVYIHPRVHSVSYLMKCVGTLPEPKGPEREADISPSMPRLRMQGDMPSLPNLSGCCDD